VQDWLKIFDQTIPSAPKKAKSLQNNSSLVHEAEVKVKYFNLAFGLKHLYFHLPLKEN